MTEEKQVKKSAAKKAAPKKSTAKKPVAKKAVAKPSVEENASRIDELKSKFEEARSKAQAESKRFGLAYAGMFAAAYDLVSERVEKGKESGGEKMEEFIKRGEQLREETQEKIDDLNLPKDLDGVKEKLEEQLEELKKMGNFDDLKEKFDDIDIPKDFDSVKEKFTEAYEDAKAKMMPSKNDD